MNPNDPARPCPVAPFPVALAVGLSACGSSGTKTGATASPTTAGGSATSGGGSTVGGGQGQGTGDVRLGSAITAASSSMEVQNQQSGQVTVSWTSTTTFGQTVTVAASAVTVGDCVTVTGTPSGSTITAKAVTISQPAASGTCASSAFGGGGRGPTAGRVERRAPSAPGGRRVRSPVPAAGSGGGADAAVFSPAAR